MNTIRRFLHAGGKHVTSSASRFDRYYHGLLQAGSGYPTADEARRDLKEADKLLTTYGWPR